MSRAFFDQVDDEVRGMVGPAHSGFETSRGGRLIKVFYADPAVHFEVQILSARWAPLPGPCLEAGLHLEKPEASANEALLRRVLDARGTWAEKLPDAEGGPAIGPMAAIWRRLSEVLTVPDLDEDTAGEVAELLALYIASLRPLLEPG